MSMKFMPAPLSAPLPDNAMPGVPAAPVWAVGVAIRLILVMVMIPR